MATNNREPWPWEQPAPANVWQISPEQQYERDQIRKRMLEEELAEQQRLAQSGDRIAAEQVPRLQREIGNDVKQGRYQAPVEARRDVVPDPFADKQAAGREPWPWEQPAPQARQHAFDQYPASLENYRSPYELTAEDFRGPAKPPSRNPAAMINDYVIEAANAVLGGVKSIIDFAKPGTELAQKIQDLVDVGERSQSLITQEAKQELEEAIAKDGWEAIRGVGGYVLKSPGLATSYVLGSIAGPGGSIKVAKEGARVLGFGAKAISRSGLGAGAAYGAAAAGGDAAGNAYEMVNQSLLQQGYDPVTANELATQAARRASVAPAAIGGVTGMFGVERLFSGLGRGGAIRTGLSEGLQEGFEEGATQYSANVASQPYVPGLESTRGVVGSAALGAALGGISGAGVGLFAGRPVDMLAGRPTTDGQGTPNPTAPVPTFNQVETDPNKVPREVAPGIFYTPSTGLYTVNEGGQPRVVGREMPRLSPESGPYDLLGAGAPNVNVNQGTLPGIPMALDQNVPTAADIEQMALAVQPGQQEMFYPNGQPTYGAQAPDSRALAEARLQAEGLKPTDKRVELATQAEEALAAGAIDEDTYNQIFSLLRESKYGRVGKIITGAQRVAQTPQAQQAEAQGPQTAVPAAATVLTPEAPTAAAQQPTNVVEPGQEIQESQQAEQQAQMAEDVDALRSAAEDLRTQIRVIEEQQSALLTKSGRLPVKGSAKAKQYEALETQRAELRQQWDAVDRRIRAAAPVAVAQPMEAPNAVQVESTAAVPVQPRAEAGTRVGEEVRGAQEPAAEGQQAEVGQAEEAVSPPEGWATTKEATKRLVKESGRTPAEATAYVKSVAENGFVREADIQSVIDNENTDPKSAFRIVGEAKGMAVEAVGEAVDNIVAKWKNVPALNVVQSEVNLPAKLQTAINKAKAQGKVPGIYWRGEVYLVADNLTNTRDVYATVMHEVAGHFGLRAILGNQYAKTMDDIYAGNRTVRKLADTMMKKEGLSKHLAVEEVLADMAERVAKPNREFMAALRNVFVAIRKWARDTLGVKFMSDNDVRQIVANARKYVIAGDQQAKTAIQLLSSEKFRKWFGNSKVVDKDGQPLVVYHTGAFDANVIKSAAQIAAEQGKDITGSNNGIYFSKNAYYSGIYGQGKPGAATYPVYLSIQNPFVIKDEAQLTALEKVKGRVLRAVGRTPVKSHKVTSGKAASMYITPTYMRELKRLGYDGIINDVYDEIVVFDPTQIKSAISNTGEFDPTNPDITMRVKDAPDAKTTPPSEINETLQDYSVTTSKVMFDKARRGVMGLRFLRDLKDTYGNKLSGLREYAEKAFAMGARTNELLKEGSQIANRWASLGDEADALSKLAGAATAAEIHPDIALDKEVHESNGRSISNAHLFNAGGKVSDEVQAEYDQLHALWNKLTPKAQQVYIEARDYMHKNWMSRQDLLNKNVDAVYKPLIDAAQKAGNKEKVKALNKERTAYIREFGTLLAQVKGPYFPMMRFGKYYVTYKSDTYRAAEEKLNTANEALSDLYAKYDVPMTLRKEIDAAGKSLVKLGEDPSVLGLTKETKAEFAKARKAVNEAQAVLNKLVKEGDKHYANEAFESELSAEKRAAELGSRVRLANEYFRELNPVTRGFIEKLSDAVTTGLPQSQAAKARESIVQIYLAALPETSALKRQLKRKGVAGFNEDMLRAFSSHTQRDAHYLSRLEFMDDMSAELQRMRGAAKTKDQDALYNEMARRHAASLNYHQSPLENGLASLAFVYQLGVSPAFLLTNMTQPWMVSMPFMTGKHSAGKVSAALAKGFADASKAATTSFAEQGMNFEMDLKKFPEDERAMLESAMKDGLLDITLEIDLGAYAKGAGKGTFSKIMRAMGVVPHQVEVVNRVMTALAAYRLEVGKGSSKAEATEYAKKVLDKTHIDYSATNAPYWLKPGVVPFGKLLFQYRKYQIGMLSLLGNQWRNALKGESPEVRREARRMLFGLHVNHALMTGAMGLPGIGTAFFIANLLNAAFGDEDEPFEAEAEFRKYLAESFGVEEGMVAAKGLPTLLGIDLSRNVGMGDIAAPIRLLRDDKKGRDLYTEVLMAGLGPTIGGLGPQFAEGISAMANGDYYRGVEGLSPRFVRDMTRALRMSDEGLTTKAGQTVFEPDEIAAWDIALQALGVPSTFVTERQAAVSAVEGAKRTISDRRSELTRAYVQARTNGDSEALSAALEQIREYNAKRRAKREPIIKPQDLLKAYKQRRQYSADVNEQGISLPRRQRALGEYGSFANVTGAE